MKPSKELSIVGLLVFGTACSILAKLIYYASGPGLYSENQAFEKPWFQVFTMFVGMSICIVLDKTPKSRAGVEATDDEKKSLTTGKGVSSTTWSQVNLIIVPTAFDLLATGCGTTGLLYTTVSVYQMLRGAQLIFTALLSIIFLKKRLDIYNWCGIALSVSGIIVVGGANILAESNPAGQKQQIFGVVIIVVGQVMQASQVVCEEFLLQDLKMSSVRIVAWEGLFGVLMTVLLVMPAAYFMGGPDHGHLEDSLDSFYMFFHTWKVAAIVFADMIMMLFYNICGMGVTDGFSAVHRVIIETLRTLCVWILDLFFFYVVTNGGFGERWTSYSWYQAFGFVLLVAGTLTYNYRQIVFEKKHEIGEELKRPSVESTTKPMTFDESVGEEDEEEEVEEHVGSYYGQPFGSAAHSPFIAVVRDVGSPGYFSSSHGRRPAP
eukprot:CAMPEP_0184739226 /NCGR_PEP_ID=MMETSP0315-20130426/2053_1 /TAXON_ID=101924 /ORGANISM="Rhodosorus marinus, Strain UTEX LB 2760" /LENGTH=433 /DNA_ID=CAMNT_0027207797 /DNA_START=172 /DNA_END=1473 /DNA_ORIENTATION=+